jgi:Raf kinase inhibitor-like YbhB/YbcL family protein
MREIAHSTDAALAIRCILGVGNSLTEPRMIPTRQAGVALIGAGVVALSAYGCTRSAADGGSGAPPSSALAASKPLAITRVKSKGAVMVVSSQVFSDGGQIPDVYTAFGRGVTPPVMWTPVPGAKSYAVVVEDPDAPSATPYVHWVVYDIPPTVTALDDGAQGGALPAGVKQGRTSAGGSAWDPPRPPAGDKPHHYYVEVFALDTAPQQAGDLTELERAMAGHVLAEGETVGVYQARPGAKAS